MIKIAYSSRYVLDLPDGHRFPMEKYSLLIDQLLYQGIITTENLYDPGLIEEEIILLTHEAEYWEKLKSLSLDPKMMRKVGFPLSQKLIDRSRSSSMGTFMATKYALEVGISFNAAGGTHHAYADKGEGFCLLNDIAIASNYYLKNNLVNKILVVDLDVHQGNGTATIFQNEPRVFTWSVHCKDNYPLEKENSDLDTELVAGTGDSEYLSIVETTLNQLIEIQAPDIIYFQAGVDVLASDKLGHFSLTTEGCKKRDQLVIQTAYEHEIPLVVTMGGGYSFKISDIVDAHCNTYKIAFSIFES